MIAMRILCVSDYHRHRDIADAVEKLAAKAKADVIINAGDFLSEDFAKSVLNRTQFRTFVVHGNWDRELKIKNKNVTVLENQIVEYKGLYFLGIDWGHYAEISKLAKGIDPKKLIVITHDPPYGILDVSFFGSNAGMPELREVMEKVRPAMHVFGHIHESAGFMKHKGTLYVNAALTEFRKAALVEIPGHRVKVFNV
jgi:hypothetical protein